MYLGWGEGVGYVVLDFRKLGFCMRRRLLLSKASYKNVVIFFFRNSEYSKTLIEKEDSFSRTPSLKKKLEWIRILIKF